MHLQAPAWGSPADREGWAPRETGIRWPRGHLTQKQKTGNPVAPPSRAGGATDILGTFFYHVFLMCFAPVAGLTPCGGVRLTHGLKTALAIPIPMMARLLHKHNEGAVMLCGGVRLTDGLTAALAIPIPMTTRDR